MENIDIKDLIKSLFESFNQIQSDQKKEMYERQKEQDRKMYEMQKEQNKMYESQKELHKKIEEQKHENFELRRSLEFTQNELKETVNEVKLLKSESGKQKTQIDEVKSIAGKLEQSVADQIDLTRRKNIKIDGLIDQGDENAESTQLKVQNLLNEKLQMSNIKVEKAYRLKKRSNHQGPRTIIAELSRTEDRNLVLKSASKLKGTNTFINDDVCEITNTKRIKQLPELKEAKRNGKIAYFIGSKLIIKNRPQSTPSAPLQTPTTHNTQRDTQRANTNADSSETNQHPSTSAVKKNTRSARKN